MLRATIQDLRTAIIALVAFTALTGLAYPYAITGVAQAVFPHKADGSVLTLDGQNVGSSLVGQPFAATAYFHPRPSAAGTDGYDASASSGSNLAPSSAALATRVALDANAVRLENRLADDAKLPVDAVTASGSGLDPHISPAYAELQIGRVAAARGTSDAEVQALVRRYTDGSTFALLGEPRVNVLELNLALDAVFGKPVSQ
ncbi:MAG: potassium-transporting ATPase subunit KdpC [Chloroflexi bacterium]|nr:potassium-transporting ATPase subunit KdpC [Chloroflexota bacterium]